MKWSWQLIGAGLRSYGSPVSLVWLLGVGWTFKPIALAVVVGTVFFGISWVNKIKWRDALKAGATAAREAAFQRGYEVGADDDRQRQSSTH